MCGNLQEKRHRHRSQEPFCGFRGPRFGWKLKHMLQEPFRMEIYRKSAGPGFRARHFVWKFRKFTGKMQHPYFQAPILCGNLQEKTRMDIAQEPFCVEIYRKNAARARPHLDLHGPLFTLTVRTPSVWPHCLGKKHNLITSHPAMHPARSIYL